MKKLFTLTLSLAILGSIWSQKIDLDRIFVANQYRNLPSTPMDSSWRTYNVRVEVPSTITSAMSTTTIEERVNLQGWKKVYGNGHAQITINFDDLMFDGQKIDQRKEETKNKEGVITATRNYYWSIANYSIGSTYSVKDFKGNILINRSGVGTPSKKEWKSPEFSNYSEAERYFSNNRQAISNNLVKNHMEEWLGNLNNVLNGKYGFPTTTEQTVFWTSDSKKHPENEAFVNNIAKIKTSMAKVSADGIDASTRVEIQSEIDYFNATKLKYAADEKADRKIRYACNYNAAVLYTVLDQYDAAIEACNTLIVNDYDVKDGEKMIEKIKAVQELMAKNNANTRHFSIDTGKFNTPN